MESIKKTAELLDEFLRRKDFNRNWRGEIMAALIDICAKYYEPHLALLNVLDLFQLQVSEPFNNQQFQVFLRAIDPTHIAEEKVQREVGVGDGDYQKSKKEFLKNEKEKNRRDPDRIRDEEPYQALTTITAVIAVKKPVYKKTHRYVA